MLHTVTNSLSVINENQISKTILSNDPKLFSSSLSIILFIICVTNGPFITFKLPPCHFMYEIQSYILIIQEIFIIKKRNKATLSLSEQKPFQVCHEHILSFSMMGCVWIQYSVCYIDMHVGPVWSCAWVCVCLHVSLTDVALYAQPDPHQREHACEDLFKNRCSLGSSSNIYYSLSHSLTNFHTNLLTPHPPTHRKCWFCIIGRQKVILALLAVWVSILALQNQTFSSYTFLQVIIWSSSCAWRLQMEMTFVSLLFLHMLVVPCFIVLITWMVYCLLIYKSVEAAVWLHWRPKELYRLEPTQEYFMCGTAVLSSGLFPVEGPWGMLDPTGCMRGML